MKRFRCLISGLIGVFAGAFYIAGFKVTGIAISVVLGIFAAIMDSQ